MKLITKISIAIIAAASVSFCSEINSAMEFINEKIPPKEFFQLKATIDSENKPDTIQINECFERIIDTAGFNIDSLYSNQIFTKNRYEYIMRTHAFWKKRKRTCQGYSIFINGYNSAKFLRFSDSTSLRFIAQSSHDANGSPDLMVVKFSKTKYAYVREHVCGMAIIPYIKEKIIPEEFILGETTNDIWHIVEFKNNNVIVEDVSKNGYKKTR